MKYSIDMEKVFINKDSAEFQQTKLYEALLYPD